MIILWTSQANPIRQSVTYNYQNFVEKFGAIPYYLIQLGGCPSWRQATRQCRCEKPLSRLCLCTPSYLIQAQHICYGGQNATLRIDSLCKHFASVL